MRNVYTALIVLACCAAAAAQDAPAESNAPGEAQAAAPAPNLLVNGSFDDVNGLTPDGWDLYVLPGSDARGAADTAAYHGKYAAAIEMPGAHPANPVLNWSQNIQADLAGKTLRVSGYIRTENATEAAIWIQCWARNPVRVVHGATTFDTTPVYGTQDWQPVQMTVDVPQNTDFVTCRCVLRGRGTAWFDDILVTMESTAVARRDTPKPPEPAQDPPPAIRAPEPSEPAPTTTPSATPAPTEAQRAQAAAIAATAAMNRSLGQLLSEPEAERDTIDFGAPSPYPFTPWPPGLSGNDPLLQWLTGPAPWPSTPVATDQERRR